MIRVSSSTFDWLSWTMPLPKLVNKDTVRWADALSQVHAYTGGYISKESVLSTAFLHGLREAAKPLSRRPYSNAYRIPALGMTIAYGGQSNILCELSGQGCMLIDQAGYAETLIERAYERVTRVDVAIDLKGDHHPQDIVDRCGNKRMSARGSQDSATGQTRYIGSQKSERYCRVYRYHEPHPRANETRIEAVLKGAFAKDLLAYAYHNGAKAAHQAAMNVYKFQGIEKVSDTTDTIKADTKERTAGGTIIWLISQCAPAFHRLVREGHIQNPEEWCERYLLAPVRQTEQHMDALEKHFSAVEGQLDET